ncbi:MAG: hypothetical protein ACLFQP_08585 [Halothece sp.]
MNINPFQGVWERQWIQFDLGEKETHQKALWIQGNTYFADVRSATFAGKLTPERYLNMKARSRFDVDLMGFAGTFTYNKKSPFKGTCTWHHQLAITPRLQTDSSNYEWLDENNLIETGTCEDDNGGVHHFTEYWSRIFRGVVEVWQRNELGYHGQVMVTESWLILVHEWRSLDTNPLADPEELSAFSASAWQKINGIWTQQWGSDHCLGNEPLSEISAQFWQNFQLIEKSGNRE